MRALVVVAVAAELTALETALASALGGGEPMALGPLRATRVPTVAGEVVLLAGGVGPAAAAASTATALSAFAQSASASASASDAVDVVLSMGIAGGFAGHAIGSVLIGRRSLAADLGCQVTDRFLPLSELGFGVDHYDADARWLALAVDRARSTGRVVSVGDIATVSTVTGTAAAAAAHAARHASAGEAMEGFGVATAAALFGVAFLEVRTISNAVGPRDTSQWQLGDAFAALGSVAAAVFGAELPW